MPAFWPVNLLVFSWFCCHVFLARKISVANEQSFKGAVSFQFWQGLLTLMCNNLKLKADINFFFFVLHRHGSKVFVIAFLFDIDANMASSQNGVCVCELEPYFWKYLIFCVKYLFFSRCFHFLHNIDNYIRGY